MIVSTNKTPNLLLPQNIGDAGYDVVAMEEPTIMGVRDYENDDIFTFIDYIEYDTGVSISPELGFHSYLMPRSSISNTNLILCNSVGLIDNGYTGTLKMRFRYIFQPKDLVLLKNERFGVKVDQNKIYQIGQRIGQIVFSPTTNAQIKQIGEMPKTVRGASGFGSTGL